MGTFLDHLIELRSKVLISICAVVLGAVVAHVFHEALIEFLLRPISGRRLFFLSPLDPLFFIFKIDLFAGFILALPVVNWCGFSYVKPAMRRSTWLMVSLLYCFASALILAGLAYAYLVMVPISLGFLLSISISGIENMITANSYLTFLLVQSLIIAVIFQIPLFVIAGSYIGAFNIETLSSKRRYIYVAGLIVLAVITPTTDLFNLGIVALPACIIFEGSVVATRVVKRFGRGPATV